MAILVKKASAEQILLREARGIAFKVGAHAVRDLRIEERTVREEGEGPIGDHERLVFHIEFHSLVPRIAAIDSLHVGNVDLDLLNLVLKINPEHADIQKKAVAGLAAEAQFVVHPAGDVGSVGPSEFGGGVDEIIETLRPIGFRHVCIEFRMLA